MYLYTASTLSKAMQQATTSFDNTILRTEVEGFIDTVNRCLPTTKKCHEAHRKAQSDDTTVPGLPAIAEMVGQKGTRPQLTFTPTGKPGPG